MLAGIITDSNNFKVRVGPKTYAAAMQLRQWGASPTDTAELLKDDFSEFQMKSKIFSSASEIKEGIITITVPEQHVISTAFLAQIADAAIANKGILAVFVLGKLGSNSVGMSARSNGKYNVMVIAESLGGGGHFSAAASQFSDVSIADVIEKIKSAVGERVTEVIKED